MNKRQQKKRRKLRPTYNEWLKDITVKIGKIFDIDPYERADGEIFPEDPWK